MEAINNTVKQQHHHLGGGNNNNPRKLLSLTNGAENGRGKPLFIFASDISAFHKSVVLGQEGLTVLYVRDRTFLVEETEDQLVRLLSA